MMPFQTISEFIENPFGISKPDKKDVLENKYHKSKSGIKIAGYTMIDDNYLLHVQIPSDSNQGQMYDVVVLFFTDETTVKKRTTFSNYYVKFFSNSPSFIYQYAYLYKENGFLIDFLYDKLDANYQSQAPTKTNKNMELYYDKSIYCACRYLLDDQMIALSKLGIILKHKKSQTKFFQDIKSFENIKMDAELRNVDKKINKELEENKKVEKKKITTPRTRRTNSSHRVAKKTAKTSTRRPGSKSGIKVITKKGKRHSTLKK